MQAMAWMPELGVGAREGAPLGVERDVGHDQGGTTGGDIAGDAFAHRDAQMLEALGRLAGGDGVVELLGLLVDHQHGPTLGVKEPGHLVHDDAQDVFEFEGLGQRAQHRGRRSDDPSADSR